VLADGRAVFRLEPTKSNFPTRDLAGVCLARAHLAELALFLHGSVITASLETMFYPPLPQVLDKRRFKVESLLAYNNNCAGCGLEMTLPHGPSYQIFQAISIGIKDIRIGDVEIRSAFQSGRSHIYACFSEFLTSNARFASGGWSDSFIPFFFHFAQIYHVTCKHSRGKDVDFFLRNSIA